MASFLKKLKEMTPQGSVKFQLHHHLSGPEPARSLKRIHASELTREEGFCPRFYALADLVQHKPKNKWLTTSEQVTYHMGRVLQDSVVNWFADMGKAICHWKCVACGTQHDFQLRPSGCKECGCKKFDPVEVRFLSAETGASCGIDMMVAMGETKLRPVELKTMDKDQFKDLKAPLAEHRWRTSLYLKILSESDSPWASKVSHDKATIFYISKGGYGCADPQLKAWGLTEQFSPFKEWDIGRDDKSIDDLCRRSKAVKTFREGTTGMPCGICATALDKRATKCGLRSTCFSGDHPPVFAWKAPK